MPLLFPSPIPGSPLTQSSKGWESFFFRAEYEWGPFNAFYKILCFFFALLVYIIDRSDPKKSGGKCPFKYSDLLIFFLKVYDGGGEEGSVSIRINNGN